ncbi:hypothetical protein ACW2Q0_09510 [Nocardia sp. R16R-3T]
MPTKTLQIPTTDGQADAFAAFPDHGERHPGVLTGLTVSPSSPPRSTSATPKPT